MRKGEATRERILEVAEASVLAKGFGATSIEEVIAEAGITKSGFYHFRDKNELAHHLLRRYVAEDQRILDEVFGRAAELSEDPLQSFLIGLKLLAEVMSDLPGGHPGCMIASICYQERLFDRRSWHSTAKQSKASMSVSAVISRQLPPFTSRANRRHRSWRRCFRASSMGYHHGKVTGDSQRLVQQILAYRAFIKMQFSDLNGAVSSGQHSTEAA